MQSRRHNLLATVMTMLSGGIHNASDMLALQNANSAYMNSSRGKGGNKRGQGSTMYTAHNRAKKSTYFPPHRRNGAKECHRRRQQGRAGTQYVHGAQYPSI